MAFNQKTRGLDNDGKIRYVGGMRVSESKRLPGNRIAGFQLPIQILPKEQDPFNQRRVPIISKKKLLSIKERLKHKEMFTP